MANGDGSSLNEVESRVCDALKGNLGTRATVTKVKQMHNRVIVEIVSPNDFQWAADTLGKIGPELAKSIPGGLDINLTTWWKGNS